MPVSPIILLPMTYLGPVQLYCRYFEAGTVMIEQNDNYQKQTYRSRCDIYGANGRLSLSIPVKHESGMKRTVKSVKIDYDTDWRRMHWKGIESAYNSSPYFEFYRDIFEKYYRSRYDFLIDLCLQLNENVLQILNIQHKPELTSSFHFPGVEIDGKDLREVIHPKRNIAYDREFRIVEYSQVFAQTHGFIPNLSILDLIFNMGPESGRVLRESLPKLK